MEKKAEVKSGKRSIWTMLRESMNKANSGCGPGCGCHAEKQDGEKQQKDKSRNSGNARG